MNKQLYCPYCASILERQKAEYQPDIIDCASNTPACWFPFKGWQALQCPSCNFFVQNSESARESWQEIDAIALARGATEVLPDWAEDWGSYTELEEF